MNKFLIFLSSIMLIVTLTTFNPNNLNLNLRNFQVKKIEVKNVKILSSEKLKKLFYKELSQNSLFVIDKKIIDKILLKNKIINHVEFKKIYPSKLVITVYEKEIIAVINYKKNKFYLTKKGEEIKFFKNKKLENLPNIFGKQENFLKIYVSLNSLNFPISKLSHFIISILEDGILC